jgi:transposase-like protein
MDNKQLTQINDFVALFETYSCPVCRSRFEYQSGSKVFRFKCSKCGLRLSVRSEKTHLIYDLLPTLLSMVFSVSFLIATFVVLNILVKGWGLRIV